MDFSKYLNDLQNKAKTDKSLDIEKEAMDYLGSLDFSDPQNVAEAENYLGTFINDKLGKNVEVSRLEAKVAHMLVTKMALQEVGFGDLAYMKAELEGKMFANVISGLDSNRYPIFKNTAINTYNEEV